MYGIVEITGHQYKISTGDLIDVETLNSEIGTSVTLNNILFISSKKTLIGTPFVKDASITVQVLKHAVSKKLLILKRSPGSYRKKQGHRQGFTSLLVTEINDGQGNNDILKTTPKKITVKS